MTSTKTLSDKGSARTFFRFTLKQNAQHYALYQILALFAMVLPAFLMIQDFLELNYSADAIRLILNKIEDIVSVNYVMALVVSGFLAVLAGMSAMAYVNDKTAVGCYHSFPIRRESMFLTESLTRAAYYFVSYLVACGISFLMMSVSLKEFSQFSGLWFRMILSGALLFCLLYSVILFAGGLCGTNLMKFLMTGVILFLPLVLYLGVIFMIAIAVPNLYESYYLSRTFVTKFSPAMDAAYRIQDVSNDCGFPVWTLLPEALIFYAGALLLHKFRRSEDSGTTIIWKPLLKIVKYLLIFAAALLGAAVFYEGLFTGDSGHVFKMFIGAFAAAFLAFLVANCLLYRSTRAMFRDLKPFALFLAGLTVFLILVPVNVTGLVGKPYSVKATKSVEFSFNSGNGEEPVIYTDPETLEWMIPMMNPNKAEDPMYTEKVVYYNVQRLHGEELPQIMTERYTEIKAFDENDNPVYYEEPPELYPNTDSTNYTLIQRPKFGIPLAVQDRMDCSGALMDRLTATPEYADMRNALADIPEEAIVGFEINLFQNSVNLRKDIVDPVAVDYMRPSATVEYANEMKELTPEKLAAAVSMLEQYRYDPAKRLSVPVIGRMEVSYLREDRTYNMYVTFPIYADDAELISAAAKLIGMEDPVGEGVYAAAADSIREAVLVDTTTGEGKLLDSDTAAGLFAKTVSLNFVDVWSLRIDRKSGTSKYAILVSYPVYPNAPEGEDDCMELRFRADAVSDDELDAMFASLK